MSDELLSVADVRDGRIGPSSRTPRTALPVLLTVDEAADLCAQPDARSTR